jgi:hypothetical protein
LDGATEMLRVICFSLFEVKIGKIRIYTMYLSIYIHHRVSARPVRSALCTLGALS